MKPSTSAASANIQTSGHCALLQIGRTFVHQTLRARAPRAGGRLSGAGLGIIEGVVGRHRGGGRRGMLPCCAERVNGFDEKNPVYDSGFRLYDSTAWINY